MLILARGVSRNRSAINLISRDNAKRTITFGFLMDGYLM